MRYNSKTLAKFNQVNNDKITISSLLTTMRKYSAGNLHKMAEDTVESTDSILPSHDPLSTSMNDYQAMNQVQFSKYFHV